MASTTETKGRKAPSSQSSKISNLVGYKRKKMLLEAYDRLGHLVNREREERRAEVERKAREGL